MLKKAVRTRNKKYRVENKKEDSSAVFLILPLCILLIFLALLYTSYRKYDSVSNSQIISLSAKADRDSAENKFGSKGGRIILLFVEDEEYWLRTYGDFVSEYQDADELINEINGGAELQIECVEEKYGLFHDFTRYEITMLSVNGRRISETDKSLHALIEMNRSNMIWTAWISGIFAVLTAICAAVFISDVIKKRRKRSGDT